MSPKIFSRLRLISSRLSRNMTAATQRRVSMAVMQQPGVYFTPSQIRTFKMLSSQVTLLALPTVQSCRMPPSTCNGTAELQVRVGLRTSYLQTIRLFSESTTNTLQPRVPATLLLRKQKNTSSISKQGKLYPGVTIASLESYRQLQQIQLQQRWLMQRCLSNILAQSKAGSSLAALQLALECSSWLTVRRKQMPWWSSPTSLSTRVTLPSTTTSLIVKVSKQPQTTQLLAFTTILFSLIQITRSPVFRSSTNNSSMLSSLRREMPSSQLFSRLMTSRFGIAQLVTLSLVDSTSLRMQTLVPAARQSVPRLYSASAMATVLLVSRALAFREQQRLALTSTTMTQKSWLSTIKIFWSSIASSSDLKNFLLIVSRVLTLFSSRTRSTSSSSPLKVRTQRKSPFLSDPTAVLSAIVRACSSIGLSYRFDSTRKQLKIVSPVSFMQLKLTLQAPLSMAAEGSLSSFWKQLQPAISLVRLRGATTSCRVLRESEQLAAMAPSSSTSIINYEPTHSLDILKQVLTV